MERLRFTKMNKRVLFIAMSLAMLSILQLAGQEQETFKVFPEQADGSVFIYASNDELYPQSVELILTLTGVKPKEEVPDLIIVPAKSEKFLLAELVPPEGRSWSYKYNYRYFMGDMTVKHNDEHVYRLPYQTGRSFKLDQGYNGTVSHMGINALDFTMDQGTTVLAARGGIVVSTMEDSNYGCGQKSCADYGNYVRIMHDDGTFADYYHLQQNGALVAVGNTVKVGDEIAKSGNTGFSTGPHLHFIVYKLHENGRTTFQTLFKTGNSESERLKEKNSYRAVDSH